MRSLPVIEQKWRSGGPYIADRKPTTRITVQEPWPNRNDADFLLTARENVGTHKNKAPLRWFQHASNHQPEREIPNITTVSIDRSIEQDAGTINFTIGNQWHHEHGQAPNQSVLGMPGYFTYNRGESMEARARWGHEKNEWSNMLVPNALLRVYTGFGGDQGDIDTEVAAGNLALYGMFLADEVVISTDGTINITGRDMAKLLIEQQLFPPLVPSRRYPLSYNRWREEEVRVRAAEKMIVTQSTVQGPAVSVGEKRTAYVDSSVDRWYGSNASIYGHRGTDSVDSNPHSYALSVGNSGPDRPFTADWWQYDCGEAMNSVYLHPWAGNYTMYVSVKEGGQWQGTNTVPYDSSILFATQSPAVNTGANIPYVAAYTVPHETAREYVLPRSYLAESVRITFRNHAFSGLGVWKYRCGIREIRLRGASPSATGGGVEMVSRTVETSHLAIPWTQAAAMRVDPEKSYSQGYLTVTCLDQSDAFGDARILPIGGGSKSDWADADCQYVGSTNYASNGDYVNQIPMQPPAGGKAGDFQVLFVSTPYGTTSYGAIDVLTPNGWELQTKYISPSGYANRTTSTQSNWMNVAVFTKTGTPTATTVQLSERVFAVTAIMLNFRSPNQVYQFELGKLFDSASIHATTFNNYGYLYDDNAEEDGVVPVGQDSFTGAFIVGRWSNTGGYGAITPAGYSLVTQSTANGGVSTYSGMAVKEYTGTQPLADQTTFTENGAHFVAFHFSVSDATELGGEGTLAVIPTAVCYTKSGDGYYVLAGDGSLRTHGDAQYYGTVKLAGNVMAWDMAMTYTGKGYWILTTDGWAHPFGDAPPMKPGHAHTGVHFSSIASHPTDYGVWLLRSDGKVWSSGASTYRGQISNGGADGLHFYITDFKTHGFANSSEKAQCISATSTGKGYWILTSTGRVFCFGDAPDHGEPHTLANHDKNLFTESYWKLLPAPDDKGYLLLHASGQISVHGTVGYFGGPVPGTQARLRYDGDYTDYTDIVKDLLLWSGFLLRDEEYPDTLPTPVYGSLESTGAFSSERLPDEMFDKRPVIDAITALREPVGYITYVDHEGRFIFTSPNWWHIGNFDENGQHVEVLPEIDEAVNVTSYTSSTSDQSARSVITISSHDPYADLSDTITTKYVPPSAADLRGLVKPALWVNDFFMDPTEQQIMAELIGLHITFSERLGQVSCLATPHIEINDQVRIYERQTETTHVHYVRGINFTHDIKTGQYMMTLTTHWLGEGTATDSPIGGVLPASPLLQQRMLEQQFAKMQKDVGGRIS